MDRSRIAAILVALCLSGCGSTTFPINHRSASVATSRQPRPEPPELRRLPNGHYRVRRDWAVECGGRRWQVQKGYTSNGITAPGSLKSSLGDGVSLPETWAAVFHDWLFTQPGISRSTADQMFYELLIAYGVSPQKARLMHATVSAYSLSKTLH